MLRDDTSTAYGISDDRNTIVDDLLARLSQLAIASSLGGQVDDDRAGWNVSLALALDFRAA